MKFSKHKEIELIGMRGNLIPAIVNLGNYLWPEEGKDSRRATITPLC